ncbi:MAG: alpha/beta hydrolase [Candidatus Lokiarchaeota archaeon]|nr:alpha/beta hydrolase [Candidatus Lokiarchaeota archaeon]
MVSRGMKSVIKILKDKKEKETKKRVEESRAALEELALLSPLPKDVELENVDAGGVPAAWVIPPGVAKDRAILYLHGGGYIEGSITSHQDLAHRISKASETKVLLLDYRLAPEHLFPAALEDSVSAYEWLINSGGFDPKNLIIAGDSAGGGLTISTLLKLRDQEIALPAAAVCLSPWTDLALTGDSMKLKIHEDPFISPDDIMFFARLYLGKTDPKNPFASPLYADFKGLPPLCIQVGSAEVLLDDATRLAKRAKEAGVEVQLDIWEDMIHVFQAFAVLAPESIEGIIKIGEFIKKVF